MKSDSFVNLACKHPSLVLFADDVVSLVSSDCDLPRAAAGQTARTRAGRKNKKPRTVKFRWALVHKWLCRQPEWNKAAFLLPQKGNGPGVAPNQSSQFAAPSSLRPLYLRSHALGSDREKEKKDRWHRRLEMRFLCGAAGLTRRKRVQQTERTAAVSSCCAFDLTGALVEVVRARVNPEHTGESTDPELYEDGGGIISKRLCQNLYHCPW